MKRFEKRAREEIASAFGTTSLSLQDSLPRHLDQLAEALSLSARRTTKQIAKETTAKSKIGKEHGRDRAHAAGYSIGELILEYRILRQVVIQVLEEDIPLSAVEREIVTDLTEQAVNDAATEFSATVREVNELFIETLSHDMRNPLAAARMGAQLVARYSDQPGLCLKNASRIVIGLDRIDSMIQNLLDAGRLRSGGSLPLNISECDPAALAHEVINDMIAVFGDRFVLSTEGDLKTWWSGELFRRALENLVGNAVKYGASEAPIAVSLQKADSSVTVTVHNEGNPIPQSDQSILFRSHRRAKSKHGKHVKGWGLGLTFVSGMVEAHHGSVRVESSEETGTSFIMNLPLDCREPRSDVK